MVEFLLIGIDFDQTLADTSEAVTESLMLLCKDFEVAVELAEVRKMATSGQSLDKILELLEIQNDSAPERFTSHYIESGLSSTKFMYGAQEFMKTATDFGHELVVISAKTQTNLDSSMRFLGITGIDAHGELHGDGKTKKINELGVKIYIGDQVSDIRSAKAASVKSILIGKSLSSLMEHRRE